MQVTDSRGFFVRAAYGAVAPVPLALYRAAAFPAALVYGAAGRLRRSLYRANLLRRHSLGAPTISVGNVTAGGTGKTPTVAWIVRRLIEQGKRPAILSRGYGAGPASKEGGNDEAAMLREALPHVPHYTDPDRVQAGRRATDNGADCLVLDDGFQHLRAGRDVNIVLLDALDPFGGERLLPAGTLREPLACLTDADAIILSRADLLDREALQSLRTRVARLAPEAILCETRHRPVSLASPSSGGASEAPESLAGRRVGIFCGIGNPWGFVKTVQSLGADVAAACFLPDHFVYDDDGLASVVVRMADAGAETILTTKKDAVKIGNRWNGKAPLRVIEVEIEFLGGREKLDGLLKDAIAG